MKLPIKFFKKVKIIDKQSVVNEETENTLQISMKPYQKR